MEIVYSTTYQNYIIERISGCIERMELRLLRNKSGPEFGNTKKSIPSIFLDIKLKRIF